MRRSRWVWLIVGAVAVAVGIYAATQAGRHGNSYEAASQASSSDLDRAAYSPRTQVYPDPAQATADVANALKQARRENKRVILDFGGNWCPDCRVLDIYFHDAANLPILNRSFLLVHINVGSFDQNLDLAAKYGIPLQKGVPALAVLDANGKLLYSQRSGQFEAMRRMESASVTRFLEKWQR